jgi:hypothetical protein
VFRYDGKGASGRPDGLKLMFYNEWDEINELPDDAFVPAPFIGVLQDAVSWFLPEPYCAIIRSYNRSKGKLKEYIYRSPSAAHKKIQQLAKQGHDVTVLTDSVIGTVNYEP